MFTQCKNTRNVLVVEASLFQAYPGGTQCARVLVLPGMKYILNTPNGNGSVFVPGAPVYPEITVQKQARGAMWYHSAQRAGSVGL
eukprot:3884733-Rhodomonas_salina.1